MTNIILLDDNLVFNSHYYVYTNGACLNNRRYYVFFGTYTITFFFAVAWGFSWTIAYYYYVISVYFAADSIACTSDIAAASGGLVVSPIHKNIIFQLIEKNVQYY